MVGLFLVFSFFRPGGSRSWLLKLRWRWVWLSSRGEGDMVSTAKEGDRGSVTGWRRKGWSVCSWEIERKAKGWRRWRCCCWGKALARRKARPREKVRRKRGGSSVWGEEIAGIKGEMAEGGLLALVPSTKKMERPKGMRGATGCWLRKEKG